MKRLRIALPYLGIYSLSIPNFSKEQKFSEKLQVLFITVTQLAFFLYLFLLPLSFFFYNGIAKESVFFYYHIISIVILLSLYFVTVIFGGLSKIKDANGFLAVLIFALFITTAAIMITPTTATNTFGFEGFRSLAGLSIMSFLALTYISNTVVRDRVAFKRSLYALVAGFVTFFYFQLFSDVADQSVLIILASIPFLFGVALYSSLFRWPLFLLTIAITVFLYQSDELSEVNDIQIMLFSAFIAVMSLLAVYTSLYKDYIIKKIISLSNINSNVFSVARLFNSIVLFTIFLVPVVLFTTLVVHINKYDNEVQETIEDSVDDVSFAIDSITFKERTVLDQLKNVSVGFGGDFLNINRTFFSNVIYTQGLFGLLAYVFIWTFAVYKAVRISIQALKNDSDYKLVFTLAFVIILIPLVSLFATLSMLFYVLWWVALSLLLTYEVLDKKEIMLLTIDEAKVNELNILGFNFKNKSKFVRFFVIISLLLVTSYFIFALIDTVGQV